jgi:hypothetical protein
MRSDVRPKTNQLTAIEDSTRALVAENSRGVGAAATASTHADHKRKAGASHHLSSPQSWKLQKAGILGTDFVDQLNFEFARNKNSIAIFMHRLRRVYHN